jgi:hypothetical protein
MVNSCRDFKIGVDSLTGTLFSLNFVEATIRVLVGGVIGGCEFYQVIKKAGKIRFVCNDKCMLNIITDMPDRECFKSSLQRKTALNISLIYIMIIQILFTMH